ncbi:hypothetical protein J6590_021263 [Homalodisca vitripennis]|nr:hypothetical protein J6590_021263 [Homalodisca vitripennis]
MSPKLLCETECLCELALRLPFSCLQDITDRGYIEEERNDGKQLRAVQCSIVLVCTTFSIERMERQLVIMIPPPHNPLHYPKPHPSAVSTVPTIL